MLAENPYITSETPEYPTFQSNRMVKQSPVTLQAYIREGQEPALQQLLSGFGNPAPGTSPFPFQAFEELHFARWFIIPGGMVKNRYIRPSLMYAANVDGKADAHIQALSEKTPELLDRIFQHCDNYPEAAQRNPESRLQYLNSIKKHTPAFYVGAPGRSVQQIKNEAKLHEAVAGFVEKEKGISQSAVAVLTSIRAWLSANPAWNWASERFHMPRVRWVRLILFGIFVLLPLLPFIAILLLLIHFIYEKRQASLGLDINQVDIRHIEAMKSQEDFAYQNQLSQVFEIKPGLYHVSLRLFLWITNILARLQFVKGALLGTPTIHFARWVIIDDGRRFIFLSNFDGSFDEYLGDFIDNGGWGLNAIYGNSVGYPPTFFLFGKGSYDIGKFLGWGRYYQVETQAWYSAYPGIGLPQVNYHSQLRQGLFNKQERRSEQIEKLLRLI